MSLEQLDFHSKLNSYHTEVPGRMYMFEITKLCGYSTFIFVYKDETMLDLYNRVSQHFRCKEIKGLYIDNHLHINQNRNRNRNRNTESDSDKNTNSNTNNNNNSNTCNHLHDIIQQMLIPVPISSLASVREFVVENLPHNLRPIYGLPYPVVYRIYLDDGHCHLC